MPSQQLDDIIQMLRSRPIPQNISVEETRAGFEELAKMFPVPPDVKSEPVDAAGVPAEWISVPGSDASAVVLYLHGGGYAVGSLNTHRDLVGRICRASGARALSVDYRLAPEHPFPAAVDDASAAYRWLLAGGVDASRIEIAGDSAGGGLAAAALLALRDAGQPLPAAAVCLSPWLDLAHAGESIRTKAEADPMVRMDGLDAMAKMYAGDAGVKNPLVSPLYADLTALPPMLIQVGTEEVLLDDSIRFAERAQAAGVDVTLEVWDGMIHVWQIFAPMLPEGQQAIDRVGEYVREKMGARVAGAQAAAS